MEFSSRHKQNPLHRWKSLRSELLWVHDGPSAAGALREKANHSIGYWVWLIRRGKVRIEMDDNTWEATAGQWVVTPQGVITQDFSKDVRILSIHFRCQWPTGANLFSGNGCEIWNAKEFPQLERSALALCRIIQHHFPQVRYELIGREIDYPVFLRFEQRFQQLLINFHQIMTALGRTLAHAGAGDERVLRAARYMHKSPLNGPFPAERLQQEAGLGRAHLDRLYSDEFNVSTWEYWELLRQEVAMRNLEFTALSVKEIGFKLGFKQASHFTKWFFRRVGKTPKTYRDEPPAKRVF